MWIWVHGPTLLIKSGARKIFCQKSESLLILPDHLWVRGEEHTMVSSIQQTPLEYVMMCSRTNSEWWILNNLSEEILACAHRLVLYNGCLFLTHYISQIILAKFEKSISNLHGGHVGSYFWALISVEFYLI
jgi:hypothetical protein